MRKEGSRSRIPSRKIISRLSNYRFALEHFSELGFHKIISNYLADAVGVSSAQVRKDFSLFDVNGNKRGGYNVEKTLSELRKILCKEQQYLVIIVGAGNLGTAFMKYHNFHKTGIRISACFDIDPFKMNSNSMIPVLPIAQMPTYVAERDIRLAMLCVPDFAAQSAADELAKAGIKGILNFAPTRLKKPPHCIIHSVNVEVELENMIYFVSRLEETE